MSAAALPIATPDQNPHRFCIAPMLDWTDRHERYFLRLITQHALLYTEMVTTGALIHGDIDRHLRFNPEEHPLALQLGGSNPDELAQCAAIAQTLGYDEINLNVGCPSDRVQSGRFGACLMSEPALVAECVQAMLRACDLPVTVKCRIGIDDKDSDEFLQNFIETVAAAGCKTFVVHARIAILKGLSPKENRDIPPLNYPRVFKMKRSYPELQVVINGGIKTLEHAQELLNHVDGVMVGREAYHNPWMLNEVDALLFGAQANPNVTRMSLMQEFLPYVARELAVGTPLQHMSRHVLGLFHSVKGGKAFRRHISENAYKKGASISVLEDALDLVSEN